LTLTEIERLFEDDSPLLRENPYAVGAPVNTVRARRSDWRIFIRFCIERHYTPLPDAPVVVREFLEASFGGAEPNSVATVERNLSTIAHAHTLADLPDPIKSAMDCSRIDISRAQLRCGARLLEQRHAYNIPGEV